jgi:hypothetical protein
MQPDWKFVVLITPITIGIVIIIVCVAISIRKIATQAYQSGAPPDAAKSFSIYGIQVAKMATVFAIIVATVLLSMTNNLNRGAIGILSGIAGYVLGSSGKISSGSSRQAGRESSRPDATSAAEDFVHEK